MSNQQSKSKDTKEQLTQEQEKFNKAFYNRYNSDPESKMVYKVITNSFDDDVDRNYDLWADFMMSLHRKKYLNLGFTEEEVNKSQRKEKINPNNGKSLYKVKVDLGRDGAPVIRELDEKTGRPKKPKITPAEKDKFSKPTACSTSFSGYWRPPFGLQDDLLSKQFMDISGVMFFTKDLMTDRHLRIQSMYPNNAVTFNRINYFSDNTIARQYANDMITDLDQLKNQDRNPQEHNEIISRLYWEPGDASCQLFYSTNSRLSQLAVLLRATDMQIVTGYPVAICNYDFNFKDPNKSKIIGKSNFYMQQETLDSVLMPSSLGVVNAPCYAIACMVKFLNNNFTQQELNARLKDPNLAKHFIYLLTNGHVSYITMVNFLEKFLNLNVKGLNGQQKKILFQSLQQALKKNIFNYSKDEINLSQFIKECCNEVLQANDLVNTVFYNNASNNIQSGKDFDSAIEAFQEWNKKYSFLETSKANIHAYIDKKPASSDYLQDWRKAIMEGNFTAAEELLKNHVNDIINKLKSEKFDIINYLVDALRISPKKEKEVISMFKQLAGKGVGFDEFNKTGNTPLYIAIFNGNFELADYLLQMGADPNKNNNKNNFTPLRLAQVQLQYENDESLKRSYENIISHMEELIKSKISTQESLNVTKRFVPSVNLQELGKMNAHSNLQLDDSLKKSSHEIIKSEEKEFKLLQEKFSKATIEAKKLEDLKIKKQKENNDKAITELHKKILKDRKATIEEEQKAFRELSLKLSLENKKLEKLQAMQKSKQTENKKRGGILSIFTKSKTKKNEDPFILSDIPDAHDDDPFLNENKYYPVFISQGDFDNEFHAQQPSNRLDNISKQLAGLKTRKSSMENLSEGKEHNVLENTKQDTPADPSYTSNLTLIKKLFKLIDSKKLADVKLFLNQYPKLLNCQDENGNTMVHNAVKTGDREFLSRIITEFKPNCDIPNNHGNTPLFLTASYGKADLAEVLLDNGADPTHKNIKGVSIQEQANDTTVRKNNPVAVILKKYFRQQQYIVPLERTPNTKNK